MLPARPLHDSPGRGIKPGPRAEIVGLRCYTFAGVLKPPRLTWDDPSSKCGVISAENKSTMAEPVTDKFASVWDERSIARRSSLLAKTSNAADAAGVHPQLYAGTLLGYAREGRILDWDDDIDLAYFEAERLETFLRALHANGLKTFDHGTDNRVSGKGNIKIYDETYDPIPGSYWGPYTWPFVDLFLLEAAGDNFVSECDWNRVTIPRDRVLPPRRSDVFEGVHFWIPHDRDFMIDFWYTDWREYEVSPAWNHRLEIGVEGEAEKRAITTVDGRKVDAACHKSP